MHSLPHHQSIQRPTGRAPKSFPRRSPPGDSAPLVFLQRPLSQLAKLPEAFGTAITLNGSAPPRSVLCRSPEWVGMEQTMSSEKNSKKRKIPLGCSRRQGSEASRTPGIAEQRGHDAGTALGSGQLEEERTGIWRCLLQTLLASSEHSLRAGTLRPGASRPAPASPESSRHAGPGTRRQPPRRSSCGRGLDRPCARSAPAAAARLSRRSPRAARAAAAASSGGSRPPLKPEPFPGRRRPLCQSAPLASPED